MLQNECLLAKIGFDTAENEPSKTCCLLIRSFWDANDTGQDRASVDRPSHGGGHGHGGGHHDKHDDEHHHEGGC